MSFSWTSLPEKRRCYEQAKNMAASDYRRFWDGEAQRLYWSKPYSNVHDGQFAFGKWFLGGELNASVNCLDRHLKAGRAQTPAIVFEDEGANQKTLSYQELHELTCNIATILYERGVRAGDRVAIYMPMTPEAVASMLACARLGAIHTVIFGGFAKEAVIDRIEDAQAKAIITAVSSTRKGTAIKLCDAVLAAIKDPRANTITTLLCFGETSGAHDPRLITYKPPHAWPEPVKNPPSFASEHPLFILYTSGTTGKPKGLVHSTGGYLAQVVSTMQWVFDLSERDLYWCTADVGWITGHSYVTYGPLALGKSIFIYDGALNYPNPARIYELIECHRISVLYTAPTAIRMFMAAGEDQAKGHDLSSLRLLGSVGEPINPAAWEWYRKVFGNNTCEIIDSYWQTETGAMMIAPISGMARQKGGSATMPLLGISAEILHEDHAPCPPNQSGVLVFKQAWPSMARGIWGDNARFLDTYFKAVPGAYFTGDGAKMDEDGDYFISGRIDDVVNVAGHRLGTAEVESALVSHESVAEAAVVGVPDAITGQKLVAFVSLRGSIEASQILASSLKEHVKLAIGSFARPAEIHFSKTLPKTRSGKIMRRLLRGIASGEKITADTSTLEDQSFLEKV